MSRKVEDQYKKLKQREHVLVRPDTYVGSIEYDTKKVDILNLTSTKMIEKEVTFVPALYKIFDEILVNASDNKQRDSSMKEIRVNIDIENGEISIKNDGKGIPIEIHKKHNIYVPELIFGHLLTSSNYDDKQEKTTGGRNGYGAKLANIFSTKFTVETVDSVQKKKYRQSWYDNMKTKGDAKISSNNGKDYTLIKFKPDFAKFGMNNGLKNEDIIDIFKKRVYDIAGTTPSDLSVYWNNTKIPVKTFIDYMKLYINDDRKLKKNSDYWCHDEISVNKDTGEEERKWEIIYLLNEPGSSYKQVSFVNNIWTINGGSHVKHVLNQFTTYVKKTFKATKDVKNSLKPQFIKDEISIFINSLIVNPAFDSQTKETLTTKTTKFGSKVNFPEKIHKSLFNKIKGNLKEILDLKLKQKAKNTDGKKQSRVNLGANISDAADAGGRNAHNCTLILTEGLSAKTLAEAGVSVLPGAKKIYGIFPLKGKLLNVRDCAQGKYNKNQEISLLKQTLGLRHNAQYIDDREFKSLRYGKIMIMTDQDHDGSHIKGLVINFFHSKWPGLIRNRQNFIQQFITPIVVLTHKRTKEKIQFYTVPEYEEWRKNTNNTKNWTVKYYKGLGSWERNDGKKHFQNYKKHIIPFKYRNEQDDNAIVKAFSKNEVEQRKEWLAQFEPGTHIDFNINNNNNNNFGNNNKAIRYKEFVDKELILFSLADNQRSIPSIVDGLKPGQRKVLYACFLKNDLKKEVRVAQFGGYISEKTAYHHGEASLHSTIINMAQDFVGTNNINFLLPNGQFGSRGPGGADAAAPRYIHTKLNKLTRDIFKKEDECILNYLEDDGYPVEPEYYVPIIPTVLVNGSEGIGTGWSTFIPNYNPKDIIRVIKNKLQGSEWEEIDPWYRAFEGEIKKEKHNKNENYLQYKTYGNCEIMDFDEKYTDDDGNHKINIHITELPIKSWTNNYKLFLEDMIDGNQIISYQDLSSDIAVDFIVEISKKIRPTKKGGKGRSKKYMEIDDSTRSSSKASSTSPNKKTSTNSKTNEKKKKSTKKLYWEGEEYITESFLKDMKLVSSFSTTNMVLFDSHGRIKKYNNVIEILDEFYNLRKKYYYKRKQAILSLLKHDLLKLENQVRFIQYVIDGKIIIKKKKKKEICLELEKLKFDLWEKKNIGLDAVNDKINQLGGENDINDENSSDMKMDVDDDEHIKKLEKGYNYLLGMPLWSLTQEKIDSLLQKQEDKKNEIKTLEKTTEDELWINDLEILEKNYDDYLSKFEEKIEIQKKEGKNAKSKGGVAKRKARKKNTNNKKSNTKIPDDPFKKSKKTTTNTKGNNIKKKRKLNTINNGSNNSKTSTYKSKSSSVSSNKSSNVPSNPFTMAAKNKKKKETKKKKEILPKSIKSKFGDILSESDDSDMNGTSFMDRIKQKALTPNKNIKNKRKLIISSDDDNDSNDNNSSLPPKKKKKLNSLQVGINKLNTKIDESESESDQDDIDNDIKNIENNNDNNNNNKRNSRYSRNSRNRKKVNYKYSDDEDDDDDDDDFDVSEIKNKKKKNKKRTFESDSEFVDDNNDDDDGNYEPSYVQSEEDDDDEAYNPSD